MRLSPLLHHALLLLNVAVSAPLVFGLVGRALFFHRDPDDVRNFRGRRPPSQEGPGSPEPEPVRQEPWPLYPPSP
jgi:hypothetical protein